MGMTRSVHLLFSLSLSLYTCIPLQPMSASENHNSLVNVTTTNINMHSAKTAEGVHMTARWRCRGDDPWKCFLRRQ